MKTQRIFPFFPLKMAFLLLFSLAGLSVFSQETVDPAAIRAAIESNKWVFTADRSDPPIGRGAGLGTGYEVRCTGDSLIFVLPYAGTMQGPAKFPESTGPLEFTSTDFKVTKSQKPNGKWIVTVRVKDHYDVNSCTFNFFENGKATLDVMPTNRTPIDFYGSITPLQ